MRTTAVLLICVLLSPLRSFVISLKDLLEGASAQNLPVVSVSFRVNWQVCTRTSTVTWVIISPLSHFTPAHPGLLAAPCAQKPCLGLKLSHLLTCFPSSSPESPGPLLVPLSGHCAGITFSEGPSSYRSQERTVFILTYSSF